MQFPRHRTEVLSSMQDNMGFSFFVPFWHLCIVLAWGSLLCATQAVEYWVCNGKGQYCIAVRGIVLELTLDFRLHNLCLFQVIAQALLDSLTMFYGSFYIVAGYLFWFRNSHSFPSSVSSFQVVRFAPSPLDFHFILCSPFWSFWSSYLLLQIVASRIWVGKGGGHRLSKCSHLCSQQCWLPGSHPRSQHCWLQRQIVRRCGGRSCC